MRLTDLLFYFFNVVNLNLILQYIRYILYRALNFSDLNDFVSDQKGELIQKLPNTEVI